MVDWLPARRLLCSNQGGAGGVVRRKRSGAPAHQRRRAPAATGAAQGGRTMSDYSLELNEDQLQIQKWVHEFAENVVRPAGPEWDEREETPWPIIEEAAKNGLYSFDFVAQAF